MKAAKKILKRRGRKARLAEDAEKGFYQPVRDGGASRVTGRPVVPRAARIGKALQLRPLETTVAVIFSDNLDGSDLKLGFFLYRESTL